MFSQNIKCTERKRTFHAGRGIRKHGESNDRTESHLSIEEGRIHGFRRNILPTEEGPLTQNLKKLSDSMQNVHT